MSRRNRSRPASLGESERPPAASATSAASLAFAAFAMGQAIQANNGAFHPAGIAWLTLAALASAAAVLRPRLAVLESLGSRPAETLFVAALVVQLYQLLVNLPGVYLRVTSPSGLLPFRAGVVAAALVLLLGAWPPAERFRLPLLLGIHVLLGLWLVRASPSPHIDVYVFHQEGLSRLLAGQSPYGGSIPNIYGHTAFYGPGIVQGGRVQVSFPYPPLSLLFSLPGHLVGDYRYSNLAAMTLSGLLIARARPGQLATFAAALFLFTPRAFFVLEQGWTEPYAALSVSAVVYCACRARRFLPWALGLALGVKQYMPLAVPVAWLLAPARARWLKLVGQAGALALAATVPFALWDLPGFVRDVVLFQVRQPFRIDSLSYLALAARVWGEPLPEWLGFLLTLAALALALWRGARTPAGFAVGLALALLVFIAFAKQAFCNYDYLVMALLALAAAAGAPESWPRPCALASGARPRERRLPKGDSPRRA